ncbi:GyrI-like domain-containing protein [Gulosibacter sp. ACHW.36C]|uniref:GyrI-like domain-containing protein n=1 Tax=Gulosibacter sediminis TaxID=1729695 RepID=A0ABY4MYV4_9MICO|nr:GyrI-like domain-containing protein [Gulosibacter sediminis]UQN15621.1 GyrI-like domain-containing protein [Gulosibacter sediminis]
MPEKVDFKKSLDSYRAKRGEFRQLELPPRQYLAVDGQGDPNAAPEYAAALAALYPVAYALKFASKRTLERDYVVPPLEGLWWADDYASFTTARDKSRWRWTMLLLVPDWLGEAEVAAAIDQVRSKDAPGWLDAVELRELDEGACVQTLHIGSYDDETPVLARLHDEFLPANGLRPRGLHHEVYLGDPRRTAPERLCTILRQPVAPA